MWLGGSGRLKMGISVPELRQGYQQTRQIHASARLGLRKLRVQDEPTYTSLVFETLQQRIALGRFALMKDDSTK